MTRPIVMGMVATMPQRTPTRVITASSVRREPIWYAKIAVPRMNASMTPPRNNMIFSFGLNADGNRESARICANEFICHFERSDDYFVEYSGARNLGREISATNSVATAFEMTGTRLGFFGERRRNRWEGGGRFGRARFRRWR